MQKEYLKAIANPQRQRMIQFIALNEKATVSDISKELADIPKPSLYRHIKILLDAGCIEIIDEKAVRGAIEKTYAIAKQPITDVNNDDIEALMQNQLLMISSSFAKYFGNENAEPAKDMLSVNTATLQLSDEEFAELYKKIGEVYSLYLNNKPGGDRKQRTVTFISSPANLNDKGE